MGAGGDGSPDLEWLRTTPLAHLFADGGADLAPRFTVNVKRTTLPIVCDGSQIEGALDQGVFYADGRSLPVVEFELEHKGGPPKGLVRLVRTLARDLPLVLSLSSKAERGFAVADHSWGHPSKDIPLDLNAARTLNDSFTVVLQGCLHALCRNAALIGGAEDGEAVHKARIALRHIRAALALFHPVLRRKRLARLQGEVKWMSDRLGAARDADVFEQLVSKNTQTSLAAALEPRRRRAHGRLEAALASARWRLLLIELLAFSTKGIRGAQRNRRAAPFLRHRLRRARRKLAADARGLCSVTPDALHGLRKRAKMLRYDLDLVGDLPKLNIRRKRLNRARADLHTLQETLGTIHDAEALRDRVGHAVLQRRRPPPGIAASDWPDVVEAARELRTRGVQPQALRDAAATAKQLRRRAF